MNFRIATWNLEWAKPGSARGGHAAEHLESLDADIVVTTEDYVHEWSAYPQRCDGGDDWGYRQVEGRRKVIAWSKTEWGTTSTFSRGALAGRFVSSATRVEGVDVAVMAVCIPWRDAHVRSGRLDRLIWDEHLEFCAVLGEEIRRAASEGPLVVVGDFNQRVPRYRQPHRVADALAEALVPLDVVTAGDTHVGQVIDHIACTPDLRCEAVETWPNVLNGRRVSDHNGVVVNLSRQS